MPYPFTYSIGQGTYNPTFEDMRTGMGTNEKKWTSGPQPVPYPFGEQVSNWAGFGLGVGALTLLGRHKFSTGKSGWDYLIHGVRAVEEYSPGRVFRTFQVSHMLSTLETPSLQTRYFSPQILSELRNITPGRLWLEHLSRLTGRDVTSSSIMREGFRFEGGQLLQGRTGREVLLRHAGIIRKPTGAGARFQEAYARSLAGGPLSNIEKTFSQQIKFMNAAGKTQEEAFMFTGGRSRIHAAHRFISGYGTSLVERINQLARAPFELPGISGILKRTPIINKLKFGVVPSSGLKTLAKITGKLGVLGTATYMAYQELDYMTRESSILDETILSEGITTGLATLWTRAQTAISRGAEVLGLHRFREWQEEVAPGSTELSTLLAFPLIGAAGGLTIGYGERLVRQHAFRRAGLELAQASMAAGAREAFFKAAVYGEQVPKEIMGALGKQSIDLIREQSVKQFAGLEGRIISRIARAQEKRTFTGALLRGFGKVTPSRFKWMLGAAIGGTLALPFLPGALVPSERPEELEALYKGEKRVAIRKGKWWEFGRSPYEGSRIDRYRTHWYPRMLARAKEKALWGEEPPSPLERWWIENFTYELEKKHYSERPYPISGAFGEDIPFVGPLLAATLGRLIKPPVRMHEEEWIRANADREEYLAPHLKYGEIPIPGELTPGEPISPYGAKGTIGEQAYRFTEMIGLPGFTMTAIKEAVTGRSDVFDQEIQLESARRMYGAERSYWDLELGGGLGTCFISGTKITTKKGVKNIEDICIDDLVLTHGTWKPVIDLVQKSPQGQLLQIQAQSAGVNFTCTENHWIPILRRHRYKGGHVKPWRKENYQILEIQAKNIQKGDFLFYEINPKNQLYAIDLKNTGISYTDKFVYSQASQEFALAWELLEENPSLSRKSLRKNNIPDLIAKEVLRQFRQKQVPKRINRYYFINKDLAYFIGWYIAEGSTDGTKLTLTMHANEFKYAKKLQKIVENIGFNSSIFVKNNTLRLNVYSSQLARYFKTFGSNAHKKHIPQEFKDLPISILKHLVEGLVLGDGWTKGFTSVSKQLVKDLFDCRLKLGLSSYLILDYVEKGKGFYPQGTSRKDSVRHYLSFRTKKLDWRFIDSAYLVPVTSIKESLEYPDIVYDLTIEDLHYYTAEGIRVHNTELIRRLYPHRRRQIELYNPLRNRMPEWLPGPGERSPDFLHGDAFCVSYQTLIETQEGFKQAGKICPGDIITTHLGKKIPIRHCVKRPMLKTEKAYSLKISGIDPSLPLEFSEEHPIYIKKINRCRFASSALCRPSFRENFANCDLGNSLCSKRINNLEFIEVQNIQIGDAVAYPISNFSTQYQVDKYNFEWFRTSCKVPDILDGELLVTENLAWLYGVYCAEGSTNKGTKGRPLQLIFSLNSEEIEFSQRIIQEISTIFGVDNPKVSIRNNSLEIVYSNSKLARIFDCIIPGSLYEKRVPLSLYNSPKEVVWAFIAGLLEGDGSLQRNLLVLECANEQLAQDIFRLGNSSGFPVSYISRNTRSAWGLSIHTYWIKEEDLSWLIKKRPKVDFSRQPNLYSWTDGTYIYRLIVAKDEIFLDTVFGFEVDIDDSFCVIGVATHNTKVPEGEMRLPGAGYAALHPELKGIAPDDYPLIHKFAILADVAPYTDKFKSHLIQVRAAIKRKELTDEEIALYKETMKEVASRKVRREFSAYKYRERAMTPMEELLATANEDKKGQAGESSWFENTLGTYWETLAHGAETPFELLTPVSPAAKLIHQRTAVEDYERYQVYGTENAFWGHPIRDFFGPFFDRAKRTLGWEGIPEHIQEKRDLEEYFDILKYVKFTRLKRAARIDGDEGAVREYEDRRRETLFGINPYTYNFSHILRSLPRRDRDYFNEFAEADMKERVEILKMIPENEQALFLARWQLKDSQDLKETIKKGLLSEEQVTRAEEVIKGMYEKKETEGFPKTTELWAEYISTRMSEESYADWYRRTRLLEEKLVGKALPGPDWVGWHPNVELDDIKLKIVQNEGKNMYDYDLWPDRLRALARRPAVAEAAEVLEERMSPEDIKSRITDVLSANGITAAHVSLIASSGSSETVIDLQLEEDRTSANKDLIRRRLYNG